MGQKLGQHFLQNKEAIEKIVGLVEPRRGELIVEIGPGEGALTIPLAVVCKNSGARLIAIEKDRRLAGKIDFAEVIVGDAIKDLAEIVENYQLPATGYKLVGNIPYYITGKLLRTIEGLRPRPVKTILMVQKEVAERVSAIAPKMNLLSSAVQVWAEAEIIFTLGAKDFLPPPKVDSAVIVLTPKKNIPANLKNYYALIKRIFASPRKTLVNNLLANSALRREEVEKVLEKAGIEVGARGQNLSLDQILALEKLLY